MAMTIDVEHVAGNPAVAVVAGALVLREHIGAASIVGMALILTGSWLATRGRIRHALKSRPLSASS